MHDDVIFLSRFEFDFLVQQDVENEDRERENSYVNFENTPQDFSLLKTHVAFHVCVSEKLPARINEPRQQWRKPSRC